MHKCNWLRDMMNYIYKNISYLPISEWAKYTKIIYETWV